MCGAFDHIINFAQGIGFLGNLSKNLNAQGFASSWVMLNSHHYSYPCCHLHHWHHHNYWKSADFKSPDLGSSDYTRIIINYDYRLWHLFLNFFRIIFYLQPQLMFIEMRVMRPSRKEISSMLFIFTPKELKWTATRKNWRPNCTTTGLLHILNLVRWWEL